MLLKKKEPLFSPTTPEYSITLEVEQRVIQRNINSGG